MISGARPAAPAGLSSNIDIDSSKTQHLRILQTVSVANDSDSIGFLLMNRLFPTFQSHRIDFSRLVSRRITVPAIQNVCTRRHLFGEFGWETDSETWQAFKASTDPLKIRIWSSKSKIIL